MIFVCGYPYKIGFLGPRGPLRTPLVSRPVPLSATKIPDSKLTQPFQLPRVIILIESYDELSAAADRGVGELRLLDTASPPLPSFTSAGVLLSIVSL